eukprot:CAMPEP_0172447906 /NCGR_PEP_ID=MMETSP1065-20121228/7060_1 /TAXON_ID=265537 /ORGANISM="Amphiprora paludosa, Strain CCMP125" /LENGTH=826 /DNA_ID=CAMNT_0013199279 /DNA_START=35 /DNA_END=2515 /DNA_ORIENTATION=-
MNLELLDPFGRQIPDRVDATLPLAPHLHFRQPNHHLTVSGSPSSAAAKKNDKNAAAADRNSNSTNVNTQASNVIGSGLSETGGAVSGLTKRRDVPEWRAAYHVSYNRRGTYVAVGYGSGAVAVHSTSSRTLSALFRSDAGTGAAGSASATDDASPSDLGDQGITSVSWSRRSRTLLAGAAGQASVYVHDTTHPYGPEEAGLAIDSHSGGGNDGDENGKSEGGSTDKAMSQRERNVQIGITADDNFNYIPPYHSRKHTGKTQFADPSLDETKYIFVKDRLHLEAVKVPMGTRIPQDVKDSFTLPEDSDDEGEIEPMMVDSDNEGGDGNGDDDKKKKKKKRKRKEMKKSRDRRLTKHPCVTFSFLGQGAVGGSLQINPRCPSGGLAALMDGSLVLFWFDRETSWLSPVDPKGDKTKEAEPDEGPMPTEEEKTAEEGGESAKKKKKAKNPPPKKYAIVVPLWNQTMKHFITCAAFDPQGDRVYAATKDGTLMGFEVKLLFDSLMAASPNSPTPPTIPPDSKTVVASPIKGGLPLVAPHFKLGIPGGASAWHLLVSRNGKYLVLNSSDGALRLYTTETCWTFNERKAAAKAAAPPSSKPVSNIEKPSWTFQDVVSKVKFVSCDLSGDGEYVVGGANGNDNRYELSIWNATTGVLIDKLTGPAVQLYSVAWHPTRARLAVATSDGLVDVWGPKMNWTAFAPDFQALHKNVVFKEEDEEEAEKEAKADAMDIDKEESSEIEKKPPTTGESPAEASDGGEKKKSQQDRIAPKSKKEETRDDDVDILTTAPVPVFASDSEEESEAFAFETRVKNLFVTRSNPRNSKGGGDKNDD